MAELQPWRVLRDGNPKDVVLAVDFYAPGRAEASFEDLAARLGGDYQIWECVQPALGDETGMNSDDYLARWIDAIPADVNIRGLVGFCVGGIWASALGELIAMRRGTMPPIVLFDPEPVTGLVLFWQYHKILDKMGTILTSEELGNAKVAGIQVQENNEDLSVIGDQLIKLYREVGHIGLERLGLDRTRREEMMALFDSYISYLVAAGELSPASDLSTSVVVSSDSPADGRDYGSREVPFDIDRHELLRTDEVADLVAGIVG
jgi:hypothetical protein